MASFTDAIGWTGLFNGFAGKDAEKASFTDLLPFPGDVQGAKTNKQLNEPTKETAQVFLKLMRELRLPDTVVAIAFQAKLIEKFEALA